MSAAPDIFDRVEQLNSIGISLSAERDANRLLEKILLGAKSITHADGGTLYLVEEGRRLRFAIMHTDSLGIALGGTTGRAITLAPIELFHGDGTPNRKTVATHAALTGETVNIADAYEAVGFDFSGTKLYDQKTGYRSQSFLTIPMRDHQHEIIGVLQLINARDRGTGQMRAFGEDDRRLAESLSSQAAVALTNHRLIDELRLLLERFIEIIAQAIDEKSPYTGAHCRRVPELAMMIAEAIGQVDAGPLKDHHFTEAELYELKIAALLHDCGKITTPVHVVDKATKLETIFDRIHLIDTRLEVLRRDLEIAVLKGTCTQQEYASRLRRIEDDRAFLHKCNLGGEFMAEEAQARVKAIAAQTWTRADGSVQPLLSDNEVYNLCIPKGTLTPEERTVINNHIVSTQKMLEALPFPKHLRRVPEIAGGHHERMDGKGYPRGLTRAQMSLQARLMGIADIFEALTATDRPYKKPMTLSQALTILGKMKLDRHVDPDIFDVFVREAVYRRYAEKFLAAEQIDTVDPARVPGYGGC